MEQLIKKAIDGLDVDYAEIRVERSETTTLNYMGPVIEDIGTVYSLGGCVRVCVRGGWGFASFNRIEEALESALTARKMAMLIAGEQTALAPADSVVASIKNKVSIDPSTVSLEEKRELVEKYNNLMLNDKGIVTTNTLYRDTKKTAWLHTSEGTMLHRDIINTG
ncbi:unnamed protein product, partial [marine sediment metagenome]